MDGTLGAGAGYTVLSGNFNRFAIVDRVGTKIELVPHIVGANRRPIGARGFYLHGGSAAASSSTTPSA